MQGSALTAEERGALQRARIITGAMMVGVATFICVAAFLSTQGSIGGTLGGQSALNLVFLWLFGGFAIALSAPLIGRAAAGKATAGVPAFLAETIVTQAMREGAAIAGILFSMLAGRLDFVLIFGVLCLLVMASGWPKEERVREARRERRA